MRATQRTHTAATLAGLLSTTAAGCQHDPGGGQMWTAGEGGTDSGDTGRSTDGQGADTDGDTQSADTSGDGGTKLDVGSPGDGGGPVGDLCSVDPDGLNAPLDCEEKYLAPSFDPVVEWSWDPVDSDPALADWYGSGSTPLVANLTDDNGDGVVDLCDTPDIVTIVSNVAELDRDALAILDGATGTLLYWHEHLPFMYRSHGAIGDIDDDGEPELVMPTADGVVALEVDGTIIWENPDCATNAPIGLADLDADGDVEILVGSSVCDEDEELFWMSGPGGRVSTAADLDGDGDLEVIFASSAYHHDGTPYFEYSYDELKGVSYPAVVDIDDDGLPEIVGMGIFEMWILEHDGTMKVGPMLPTGGSPELYAVSWPSALDDLDGDGRLSITQIASDAADASVAVAVGLDDVVVQWTTEVHDNSGSAGATAFDFLGDNSSEVIIADEQRLMIMDGSDGTLLLEWPRQSKTLIEYASVADVDNDGSAEIVVPSDNDGFGDAQAAPTIQVVGEQDDGWVGARRIWNQWDYHITNVREDGTIPQVEPKNWQTFNNVRVNAQRGESGEWGERRVHPAARGVSRKGPSGAAATGDVEVAPGGTRQRAGPEPELDSTRTSRWSPRRRIPREARAPRRRSRSSR